MESDKQYYEGLLDEAMNDRFQANEMSLMRRQWAKPMGVLVEYVHEDKELEPCLTAVLALSKAKLWYTDRQDGQRARSSIRKATESAESGIASVTNHPILEHLLHPATKAYGAKIDADTDKELRDEIYAGLMRRSIRERDVLTMLVLAIDKKSTKIRDEKMEKVRSIGRDNGIDVKANGLGKLKTLTQVIGSTSMSLGKKGSKLQQFGLGLVGVSHLPSWLGYIKMNHHVKTSLDSVPSSGYHPTDSTIS